VTVRCSNRDANSRACGHLPPPCCHSRVAYEVQPSSCDHIRRIQVSPPPELAPCSSRQGHGVASPSRHCRCRHCQRRGRSRAMSGLAWRAWSRPWCLIWLDLYLRLCRALQRLNLGIGGGRWKKKEKKEAEGKKKEGRKIGERNYLFF
jgi:hypothetical protein